jgi:23S rRNA (uracil1939-C5)-methyltransferase
VATPLCRHFGPCGGCDWQDLSYVDQLERKRARLTDLLHTALGSRAAPVDPIIGMPVDHTGWPWHFRQKASFVFGSSGDGRDGSPVIGHYAPHSRRIVAVTECPVHAERANRLAFALHGHLARARVPPAGPTLRGVLRHLIVRTTRDGREAVAMLVVTRNDKALRSPIRAFLATEEAPDGFYLNIHDRPGPYMIGRETIRLAGRSHVRETVDGVSFLVSPTAFFQTNVAAAETLLAIALEAAPDDPPLRVLDLYAGSGLFTLPLAARGHHVVAIDDNEQAMKDAEANVRLNRIDPARVRLTAALVEDALPRVSHERFDLVILDPPRQGCPPSVIDAVFAQMRPPRAVYVSCNPEALASELPVMLDAGYRIDRVRPVDMFPHTTHIETVVTLTRSVSDARVRSASRPSRGTRGLAPARPNPPRRPSHRR